MCHDDVTTLANHLPTFILDVLRHDAIEQVSSIVKMLNNDGCIGWRDCWPHDFTAEEVVPVLNHLVHEGLVDVFREEELDTEAIPVPLKNFDIQKELDTLWFAINSKGRERWSKWTPPKEYP